MRAHAPEIPLEVECDTLDQVREAIGAGVGLVLLDNFSLDGHPDGRGAARGRPACAWRPAAGCRWTGRTRSRRPASTTSPSARSTHSAPVLDLGFDLRD